MREQISNRETLWALLAVAAVAVAGMVTVHFGRPTLEAARHDPKPVTTVALTAPVPPVALVLPDLTPTPVVVPTSTPAPPAILVDVEFPPGCDQTPPLFDNPLITADGTPLHVYETLIWQVGQANWCDGFTWLSIARCEGLNPIADNYDPTHISGSGDVGFHQINQIHGQRGGIIEGLWPEYVQDPLGNLEVAVQLRNLGGLQPWANSRHCWEPR